ncbi:MAG: ferredoxin-NADP reductase [Methylibium sp. NZG]|nr:MAG: ferredoxin-NADP reductase [Methylibium sp. NZG]
MHTTQDPHALPDGTIETDALIIGAGPVGLFQVFELGLLEIKAHVVDSLPCPGGQCIELYPDKPIYDIPALPVCSGRELTERLLKQIEPMGAVFHLGQEVTQVRRPDEKTNDRFFVETSQGTRFHAKTIFVAGGVGSFQPRALKLDGLDKHHDTQVFYRVKDAARFAGQRLLVVGGGDAALDWALHFAQPGPNRAASVVLLHRRDSFTAAPASVAKMKALCDAGEMQFIVGQATGIEQEWGRLTGIEVTGSDAQTHVLPLDALLVFFGLSPKLGPIADWGLALERKQVVVNTATFETNVPGIFAVGDVNTYPGKKKLILSGFHEAALAAFGAAAHVFPDKPVHLQYTTTSSRLHKLLGVASPTLD